MRTSAIILLVENGDMLRPLLGKILRKDGYTVLEAKSGDEALALWDQYRRKIDLVVTDLVMPGMSGKQLVQRLKLLKPEVKVIYISGYESGILSAGKKFGTDAIFLQKPFRPAELSQAVQEILHS